MISLLFESVVLNVFKFKKDLSVTVPSVTQKANPDPVPESEIDHVI